MGIKNNTYFNTFGSVTSDGKILPNNNVLYGPYNSIDAAYNEIHTQLGDAIPIGLTVGVIIDNVIKEYWFSGGINKTNLVAKANNESVSELFSELSTFKTEVAETYVTLESFNKLNEDYQELFTSVNEELASLDSKIKNVYTKTETDDKYALKTKALKSITLYYTYDEDTVESAPQGLTDNNSEVNLPSTTIKAATKTTAGVMSAADKDKLDGLTGAYIQIVTSEEYATMGAEGTLDENTVYYIKE